ncbi:hypothetical protein COUCH_22620 [Couchioplanes caeruleus]|uniref:hypothetical protein n=1 Tax=Couchioplanes caeruleus TaxID=56438 RepID=UPI0020C000EE|nr:hypothetical protein [Couchioplanes caeruleus]UQU61836.1 hypothetical protein COUCH_22620 [Couchioplanes caeruleus]
MNTLVVVVWVLIALHLVALAFAPILGPRDAGRPGEQEPRVDPCLGPVMGLPPSRRPVPAAAAEVSPDAVLQELLFSGAISRTHYRAAMARLAAQDEREHPAPFA